MTKTALVGLASVVVVASTMLAPAIASADRRHGTRVESDRLHSVPPQRFAPRRFFHGRAVPYAVIAPPVIVYAPPAYTPPVYARPVYVPVPVYYPPVSAPAPAPAPAASPPPPPVETIIEFANGRYELRGDGITTPYRWVWVPNPPTAPPAEAAPTVAPEPARRIELYRWTADDGVVHLTDRWEKVPEAYRAKATKPQS